MKNIPLKLIRHIMAFAAALLLFSCGDKQVAEESPATKPGSDMVTLTGAQLRIAGVELGQVQMRAVSGIIRASGQLDVPPQGKVSVSAPLGGVVKETDLLQGTKVRKGQVLAVLQHQDYIQLQQEYLETFSGIDYLKAEFERQEELAKENVNAKKTWQKARSEYHSARARLDGLREKLALLNISITELESGKIRNSISLYSPIDGYVTRVNVNIGSFVNANDVLFEIVNTEHLHAELTVFEKDVPRLKVGQRVLFTLANEAEQRHARVYLIGKEIGPDRSIRVHCHLDKEDRDLIPGMYLNAVVESDSARVTTLPAGAVVGYEDRQYIFVADLPRQEPASAGTMSFRMLEVGTRESGSGFTQVILPEGFSLKTGVVCKGAYHLLAAIKNEE